MSSNSIYYVYRITNIVLRKHYYGKRKTSIAPILDLGVNYFSSSHDKEFIKDQKTNPQNYRYKIIRVFNTNESALLLEIKLHKRFNVGKNKSFYNMSNQTSTRFDSCRHLKKHSSKTRKLLSEQRLGSLNHAFGTKWWNNGVVLKRSSTCPGEGFVLGRMPDSDSTKVKKSLSHSGERNGSYKKTCWNNGIVCIRSSTCPGEGFVLGMLPRIKD